MKRVETSVIFGGTGFIGTHLAQYFLRENLAGRIILVDAMPPRTDPYASSLQAALKSGKAEYIAHDVRKPIPSDLIPCRPDLVFNLAAIHREPGHQAHEYYETNLSGAEHVCAWAASVGCKQMVFTSSISPYGPTEDVRDEASLPVPETPYGISKLAAEKIHLGWQASGSDRKLLILRPGVVFGPGENGNVTRLVRSIVRGYFVYVGNQKTRKAGGYVKELCRVVRFGLEFLEASGESVALLNFSIDPTPMLESYVEAIRRVVGRKRPPFSIPRALLIGASYPIDFIARAVGIKQSINPVRVRKLYRSTWIEPRRLRELGYQWTFDLESAFRDWQQEAPNDFAT